MGITDMQWRTIKKKEAKVIKGN